MATVITDAEGRVLEFVPDEVRYEYASAFDRELAEELRQLPEEEYDEDCRQLAILVRNERKAIYG